MVLDRRSEDRMTCLQIVQCLQLFNIVSSRGPQPTCTSKPPRHSCDPCLIAIASRPTTQIKVHTASQIREAGSWEIPICAAHSCPKCASTGSHHDQSVAHSCNLGAHSFPSALPISLPALPLSLSCPYSCLPCPYPNLVHKHWTPSLAWHQQRTSD